MISPHFPPDTSAAAHRVRLLAPHLGAYGWEPTVLTVAPQAYEGRLDPDLARLLPEGLKVVRSRTVSFHWTRALGVGDLGLRALAGLKRVSRHLLASERFDALFITIYPTYPALLGPRLKREFGVPFVLDYQDPWIGAWGRSVGGGPNGAPDLKSRLSRAVATRLEPFAARAADAITAVSTRTYEDVRARHPELKRTPCSTIPLGGEPRDFDWIRRERRSNRFFDALDGKVHLCYVGTLLPLGFETLRAVLKATLLLRTRRPEHYRKLALHFFGTSNQTAKDAPERVLPVARELGVADHVSEVAPRIDYLEALTVLTDATAILMLGSSEPHYTASKLYPGLLAERPILAVYHAASSVVDILRASARPPSARVVTYDDASRAESRAEPIYAELASLVENPAYDPAAVDLRKMREFSAESLAGTLASVLDQVSAR